MFKSKDEHGFLFKLGDMVQFKGSKKHAEYLNRIERSEKGKPPRARAFERIAQAFSVTERQLQECPGGIQRHYNLRAHMTPEMLRKDVDTYTKVIQANEFELESFDAEAT